mgnify:CR=1 FL=1
MDHNETQAQYLNKLSALIMIARFECTTAALSPAAEPTKGENIAAYIENLQITSV